MKIGFKMKLKAGFKAEYKRRHDEIWPELKKLLRSSGIRDYSIFLDDETNTLFAVQTIEGSKSSQYISDNPVVQEWWKYMSDIMETNSDYSPLSVPLEIVFHMD